MLPKRGKGYRFAAASEEDALSSARGNGENDCCASKDEMRYVVDVNSKVEEDVAQAKAY